MELVFTNPLSLLRRKIGLRFDLTAWIVMSEEYKIEFGEWSTLPENKLTTGIMYGAYCSYCIKHKKKCRLTLNKFYFIYRSLKIEQLEKIKIAAIKSQFLGKKMTEFAKDLNTEKKK